MRANPSIALALASLAAAAGATTVTATALAEGTTPAATTPSSTTPEAVVTDITASGFTVRIDNIPRCQLDIRGSDGAVVGSILDDVPSVRISQDPGVTATYTATANYCVGTTSVPAPVTFTVTTLTGIDTPYGPRVETFLATGPRLVLDRTPGPVTGYDVINAAGTVVASVAQDSNFSTYVDVPQALGTTETYRVIAKDATGGRSEPSAPLEVTTPTDLTKPTAPTGVVVASRAYDGVILFWTGSFDDGPIARYDVLDPSGHVVASSNAVNGYASPEGRFVQTPATTVTYTVVAVDADGNVSPPSKPVTVTTVAAPTTPAPPTTPEPTTPVPTTPAPTASANFGLTGGATLARLVKGTLPLSGGLDVTFAGGEPTGPFSGSLTLAPTSGKLVAFGFLPVQATLNFMPTAPVTGTIAGGSATATAKLRIKLPSLSVAGVKLAGGANCQAAQLSTVVLKSTGSFTAQTGGALAGTFPISNLSGCGALTGLVSPLTAGSGNALALQLAPRP